jgi:hypothetical protein
MACRARVAAPNGDRGDKCISKPLVIPGGYMKLAKVLRMEAEPVRVCNPPPGRGCQFVREDKQTNPIVYHSKFQERRWFATKVNQASASKGGLRPVIRSDARIGHPKRKRDSLRKPLLPNHPQYVCRRHRCR